MKLTPASRADATMRAATGSAVWSPNIIAPRQMGETFKPLLPSLRYSMRVMGDGQWAKGLLHRALFLELRQGADILGPGQGGAEPALALRRELGALLDGADAQAVDLAVLHGGREEGRAAIGTE